MTTQKLITRKDIAQLLGDNFSARQIARHEKKWGLDKCRPTGKTREVLFQAWKVIPILQRLGYVPQVLASAWIGMLWC